MAVVSTMFRFKDISYGLFAIPPSTVSRAIARVFQRTYLKEGLNVSLEKYLSNSEQYHFFAI